MALLRTVRRRPDSQPSRGWAWYSACSNRAQGLFSRAWPVEDALVRWCAATRGVEHPDTLTSMNNLAEALRGLGEAGSARALHEQALDARRRTLGDEHPDTLTSVGSLALTLGGMGDVASARPLHETALDVRRRWLGPRHPATTVSAWNLLLTLDTLDLTVDARHVFDRDLAWLLDEPAEKLGADQRTIQSHLNYYIAQRHKP